MPLSLKNVFHSKPFRWLRNGSKAAAPRRDEGDSATSQNESASRKSKGSKSKSSKCKGSSTKKGSTSIPTTVAGRSCTDNEQVAVDLMKGLATADASLFNLFTSKDMKVAFEDGQTMPVAAFVMTSNSIRKSFPDIVFQYEKIKETKPGRVLVDNYVVSGTHTGEPYGFGPYPKIPAAGKHVVNDPGRIWVQVEDGKITKMDVISLGDKTGPPGLYQQIGGVLGPPR